MGSCSVETDPEATVSLSGTIDYTGSSEIAVEKQPVHYKYSENPTYPVQTGPDGAFSLDVPVDSTEIAVFKIDDQEYPLVLRPGMPLQVDINREHFPDSAGVKGYPGSWNRSYISYRKGEKPLMAQINDKLPDFRNGQTPGVISLYEKRFRLAEQYLAGTPLNDYYYKAAGEYLVKRLEAIKYRRTQAGFNPEEERKKVIEAAKQLNFFTFESLYAQRAGIRDFTHAWANTFGVEDSLERIYGQDLMEYDVKRLGYETMDSARTSVLRHIEGRRALAYAKMHLIAERIGEMSPSVAGESYRNFLDEYPDFPRYADFLRTFYDEVQQVMPGNPAVPFTLPNAQGEPVSMSDFKGKYVLLDFWASWCIPCLDEFSHMRQIYRTYSRDTFEIIAISIEEDSLRWRQAIDRFQNPWPQLYGGNGFEQETFDAYRGGGIPFYILVGPEGTIARYNDIRPSFNLPGLLDSLISE